MFLKSHLSNDSWRRKSMYRKVFSFLSLKKLGLKSKKTGNINHLSLVQMKDKMVLRA